MITKLLPGDRVSFEQNGRRLRGVVIDHLGMKTRGEEDLVPVTRPLNRKKPRINADILEAKSRPPKIRWLERGKLRKLPA